MGKFRILLRIKSSGQKCGNAIFATEEKLTFLDMKLFEDNIFNLLQIAEDYILSNIRLKSEILEAQRTEIPEIPVAVIREVLANGFAHAIYNTNTNIHTEAGTDCPQRSNR